MAHPSHFVGGKKASVQLKRTAINGQHHKDSYVPPVSTPKKNKIVELNNYQRKPEGRPFRSTPFGYICSNKYQDPTSESSNPSNSNACQNNTANFDMKKKSEKSHVKGNDGSMTFNRSFYAHFSMVVSSKLESRHQDLSNMRFRQAQRMETNHN